MKKQTRKQIVKKLDIAFSRYIRRTKADDMGIGTCVTCGKQAPWEELQCGHYFPRGRLHTRWDEDNCHIQCVGCNVFQKGNYTEYASFMLDSYNKKFIEKLKEQSKSTVKIPTTDLIELLEKYKCEK